MFLFINNKENLTTEYTSVMFLMYNCIHIQYAKIYVIWIKHLLYLKNAVIIGTYLLV